MNDIWQQKIFELGKFVLTVGKLAGCNINHFDLPGFSYLI